MKCSICGEEAENSEDLAKHMEKMHPIAETDRPEEQETSNPPAEGEAPEPLPIIPGRM